MTEKQVIHLGVPDSQDNAMTTASQALVAYPNVKKWLIVACNDNGVLGVVRALEQAGYPANDMIGVGINGQIACEEFKKPQATGFKGSIFVEFAGARRNGDPRTLCERHKGRANTRQNYHRRSSDHAETTMR